MKQIAPDHDENRYYYDRVGRLVASQDGRQRPSNKYSYTLYDALGRVTQTGEGVNASVPATIFADAPAFNTWFGTLTSKAHVTRTYYDLNPITNTQLPITYPRDNQRSRVAASTIVATFNASDDVYDYATHYSYDLTGDVATILQDIPELAANGHRHKRIDYDYDQLSGKVNAVFYQKGQADQFSYRYFYDLDNRLTQVMSSFTDTEPMGALWDREASYKYYLHGPLARTEIGHYRVQGQDYAYTLQGWIKGLNASFLNAAKDMGKDANNVASNPNRYTAADAFGYTLGFYNAPNSLSGATNINDYDPIGGSTNRFEVNYTSSGTPVPFHTDGYSQYTGNIRFIAQQTQGIGFGASVQAYRYDQLMRLNSMNTYKPDVTALSNWNITTTTGVAPLQSNYKEPSISYDRNGNILSYQRWGASTTTIQDNLTYNYIAGTNKLSSVTDASTSATTGEVTTQAANNYTYDGAGNLRSDAQSFISAGDIIWSPYGKVLGVNILGGLTQNIFAYDAMQNRIKKRKVSSLGDISTFYVRDAQGNVLAVYEKNGSTITWKEQHLYGSSRLGTVEPGVAWTATPGTVPYFRSTRILNYGWKRYEVNDHLGNVRALINDRKAYNGTTFTATLLDATDYFPFGAEMRKGTVATSYRYGFNGKELDKNGEFGGLNHYDYGFRIYNPGIGRFLSVDPLTAEYPWYSPYQFAGNGPIANLDVDGKEPISYMSEMKVGSSAINPNWGNYEWMNSHDPKLNQTMTLRHDLNTERWYVWKKTGDPSITGGAVFDPEEYRSSGAWSGRWLEYKTPERVRYEGGIAAAENFEKVVLTTMAATVGLVYVAAAAPLATSAARVAMPHILRGAKWAGNIANKGLSNAFKLEMDWKVRALSFSSDAISQYVTSKATGGNFIQDYNLLGGLTNFYLSNPFSVDAISSTLNISISSVGSALKSNSLSPIIKPVPGLIGGVVGGTMGTVQGILDDYTKGTKSIYLKGLLFTFGTIGNLMGDAATSGVDNAIEEEKKKNNEQNNKQ